MNEVRKVHTGITRASSRLSARTDRHRLRASCASAQLPRRAAGAHQCTKQMFVVGRDRRQQSSRNLVGIRVKEANPPQSHRRPRASPAAGRGRLSVQGSCAVAGRVLTDERDFVHAGLGQSLGFGDDRFETPRAKTAPGVGDDAEAARMIAAFGDFDIGRGSRRGQHAGVWSS